MLLVVLFAAPLTHAFKYLLLNPYLIRWFEKFYDGLSGQVVMTSCSFGVPKETYHREHEKYDFKAV